jgi:hypothetical protein
MLHLIVLLSVALLPLTSFAARAGTAADLTSSAIELEQGPLPGPVQKTPAAQEHRHCILWVAEATTCAALSDRLFPSRPAGAVWAVPSLRSSGPQAPTPPPRG